MPTLETRDGIHHLNLGDDENRFGPDWLTAVEDALDRVIDDPAPLVTVGVGKFYSNGLDLAWVAEHPDQLISYAARVERLFAKVLTIGVPTVAAVNGHAFGAGAMFAIAHDWRVMRRDRGFFCFPEVDIAIPFTPGMSALVQAKVTPRTAVDAMTTGRRFAGPDAHAAGLVDATADEDGLLTAAVGLVDDLRAKNAVTLGTIKSRMYAEVVARLGAHRPTPDDPA
ncbi:MAG: enoyl-CoA hydratase/isomerase family protein [Actinobacteria bacterium]|nr:enoyl-CoA hydratase/isomerase family protein [Actinomycetota bacterium]